MNIHTPKGTKWACVHGLDFQFAGPSSRSPNWWTKNKM